MSDHDVAIVGASVAGCTAATLFAREGLTVALLEKRPRIDAHKTVCTHFIQASAMPTLDRLGLTPTLEERGAMPNHIDVWTAPSGWIETGDAAPAGLNVTRRTLDPILRRLAADTPGVDLITGATVVDLPGGAEASGVVYENRDRERHEVRGRLVVGADGRGSRVARLAGIRGRVRPHNRFFYWGYYHGVKPADGRSRMWLDEPDCAYTFPNEDGKTVVLTGPGRERRDEYKADPEAAFRADLARLPDGPDLSGAEREGKLLGKLDLPNVWRPAARGRVALAGDAALASDPLWGVGCGWAFQSAEWLVDATAPALRAGGAGLERGLRRYRREHLLRLGPHHLMISDIATARPINPYERLLYRASARDRKVRDAFVAVGTRRRSPALMFRPDLLVRTVAAGR
jgi:2-polyprenyl-6-methoxyphenol hydroxylase-like FAD-dependent oxidoreductase